MSAEGVVALVVVLGVAFAIGFRFGPFFGGSIISPRKNGHCGDWTCESRSDPRCAAGNCTYHCQSTLGCHGACIQAWFIDGAARDIAKKILEKAK